MFNQLGQKIFQYFGDSTPLPKGSAGYDKVWETVGQMHALGHYFPYHSYDEANELFYGGSTVGFVIESLPLVGSSEEMQKKVNGLFQNLLPEESSLQVMLWADHCIGDRLNRWKAARCQQDGSDPSSDTASIISTLAEKRREFLNQQAFHSKFHPYSLRNFRCLISYSQPLANRNEASFEGIDNIKQQLQTLLKGLGLPAFVWRPEDLLSTLEGMLNVDPSITTKKKLRWNKAQPIGEQLIGFNHHSRIDQDKVQFNNTVVKTYQVRDYPDVWSLHAMSQLIGEDDNDFSQIPCPFILHYGVHIPKQSGPKTRVLGKTTYVERQAHSPLSKYFPSLKREYEELDFVRNQLSKGERIVEAQSSVIPFGQKHNIIAAEQILLSLFQAKEWRLESATYLHLPMLLSSLPLMWNKDMVKSLKNMQRLKTTLSTESANLLPLQGEWQGTSSPGMILSGRKGQLATWSPFDSQEGNYNVCVVGKSGSGKSVFMQELMVSTLGCGGKVFVLDVGRSFEKTCMLLEGQFIEFKAKNPLCLNPFSTISSDDAHEEDDALSMVKSVVMLMVSPHHPLEAISASFLEQAIRETWLKYGQRSNITHIATWLSQQEDQRAKDLSQMLYPYTEKGFYGRYSNGDSTVNLNNDLVVIELEELKERKDLQMVVIQMMIIDITNRMFLGDRKTPFHFVLDEAWDMLRGNQTGVFIETLARRLRKYFGSLVVGTQSMNDFYVNPGAQAALDNSDWMCMLAQKRESIDQLKKSSRLSLTPQMESQLKSVSTKQGQYAEVMIHGSNGYSVVRLILDPYSNLLYSTKADDYRAVQQLRAQGYSVAQALEKLLNASLTAPI